MTTKQVLNTQDLSMDEIMIAWNMNMELPQDFDSWRDYFDDLAAAEETIRSEGL